MGLSIQGDFKLCYWTCMKPRREESLLSEEGGAGRCLLLVLLPSCIEDMVTGFNIQDIEMHAVDSLEFHWRTLVPLELELYLSSAGVPLENLRSAGAPGDAPGHGQAVPQPGACPGHQTHG